MEKKKQEGAISTAAHDAARCRGRSAPPQQHRPRACLSPAAASTTARAPDRAPLHDTNLCFDDQAPAGGGQPPPRHPERAHRLPCWSTACRPSASRASPSTSPTVSSAPSGAVHRRRPPGPRAVHPQHGDPGHRAPRRRGAGRCGKGLADPDPPPQLHRLAARHPPRGAGGEQDGPWWTYDRRRSSTCHRRRLSRAGGKLGIPRSQAIPLSALDGDNMLAPRRRTPWYRRGRRCWNTWKPCASEPASWPTSASACRCSG